MIPFDQLPGIHPLFTAYTAGEEQAAHLWPGRVWDTEHWRSVAGSIRTRRYQRDRLQELLREQNQALGCDAHALDNVRLLGEADTVAVVTGQQAGFLTGPLYTVLKALTAVMAAQRLAETCGVPAVPIFWIETGDHDLEEVAAARFLNTEGTAAAVEYRPPQAGGRSISELRLDAGIEQALQSVADTLPDSEFSPAVLEQLQRAYRTGGTYGEGFGRLFAEWFRDTGLVLLDSSFPPFRALCAPMVQRIIEQRDSLHEALKTSTSAVASAGFSPQVTVLDQSCQLFFAGPDGRTRIDADGDDFRAGPERFTGAEIFARLEQNPAQFTPSALTRPLLQDTVLPTAVYVAGPGETAYHAQLGAAYRLFELPQPALAPRISATLVDRAVRRLLDKLHLSVADVIREADSGLARVLASGDDRLDERLRDVHGQVDVLVRGLQETAAGVEPTLVGAVENAGNKIRYQVENLEQKFLKALERRESTVVQQVRRCRSALAPDGMLQERVLNIAGFLARYGNGLIGRLRDELDLTAAGHQVLDL